LRLGGTFLAIEREENGQWEAVKTDAYPSTKYEWKRDNGVSLLKHASWWRSD
jgi:hypothetical protein